MNAAKQICVAGTLLPVCFLSFSFTDRNMITFLSIIGLMSTQLLYFRYFISGGAMGTLQALGSFVQITAIFTLSEDSNCPRSLLLGAATSVMVSAIVILIRQNKMNNRISYESSITGIFVVASLLSGLVLCTGWLVNQSQLQFNSTLGIAAFTLPLGVKLVSWLARLYGWRSMFVISLLPVANFAIEQIIYTKSKIILTHV